MTPEQTQGLLTAACLALARAAIVGDIESEACRVHIEGVDWWDTRPMIDEREHAAQVVDQSRIALAYGRLAGFLVAHPDHPHLVRIVKEA